MKTGVNIRKNTQKCQPTVKFRRFLGQDRFSDVWGYQQMCGRKDDLLVGIVVGLILNVMTGSSTRLNN